MQAQVYSQLQDAVNDQGHSMLQAQELADVQLQVLNCKEFTSMSQLPCYGDDFACMYWHLVAKTSQPQRALYCMATK